MPISRPESSCHFKAGFDPKCPKCESTKLTISTSEDLFGPCNGFYEVIYCTDCHTFLGAHPIVMMNLFKGIKESDKITQG